MSDAVVVALIVSVPPTIVALLSWRQSRANHYLINSRMTELLQAATGQARAEGVATGEQSQRDRAAPADGSDGR